MASQDSASGPGTSDLLNSSSTSDEILTQLLAPDLNWNSLWADTLTTLYSMPGYGGPDRQYRLEFWASADRMLALGGSPNGIPTEIWLSSAGRLKTIETAGPHPINSETLVADSFTRRPVVGDLVRLFYPLWIHVSSTSQYTFKPVGSEVVAGRNALVVEQSDGYGNMIARLWLDKKTALVLRNQIFQDYSDRLMMDIQVVSMVYNASFDNPALFDYQHPWQKGFTRDAAGTPEITDVGALPEEKPASDPGPTATPAPAGFDPSKSRLTFSYPPDFPLTASQIEVSVLAGSYYLGQARFGNPWSLVCTRSANGKTIAFTSQPVLDPFHVTGVQWIDLSILPVKTQDPLQGIAVRLMALSPDGSKLALYGLRMNGEGMGVYLVDLATRSIQRLLSIPMVQALAWGKNGSLVAVIGRQSDQTGDQVLGFNVGTGDTSFQYPYNPNDSALTNLMTNVWKLDLANTGQLSACVNPY